eukprot:2830031-Rhodomonas_salina.2
MTRCNLETDLRRAVRRDAGHRCAGEQHRIPQVRHLPVPGPRSPGPSRARQRSALRRLSTCPSHSSGFAFTLVAGRSE